MSSKRDEVILSIPASIFIMYLIIAGSFLGGLLGCRTQQLITTNMAVKHLLGLMTMFFFIVMLDSNSKVDTNPANLLIYAFILYMIFVVTTRMDHKWWVAFIVSLFFIYVLQAYKDHRDTDDEERERYKKYQMNLIYVSAFIVIMGFLIYLGKKKAEYKDQFEFGTFLFGSPQCKFNQPEKMGDFEALGHIF